MSHDRAVISLSSEQIRTFVFKFATLSRICSEKKLEDKNFFKVMVSHRESLLILLSNGSQPNGNFFYHSLTEAHWSGWKEGRKVVVQEQYFVFIISQEGREDEVVCALSSRLALAMSVRGNERRLWLMGQRLEGQGQPAFTYRSLHVAPELGIDQEGDVHALPVAKHTCLLPHKGNTRSNHLDRKTKRIDYTTLEDDMSRPRAVSKEKREVFQSCRRCHSSRSRSS